MNNEMDQHIRLIDGQIEIIYKDNHVDRETDI